jgi:NTE family protein
MNADLLHAIPLFAALSPEAQAFIQTRLTREVFASGETIVRQGDTGDSLYIITDGLVKVTKRGRAGASHELARLRAGDHFGEMSLLAGQPRSADIVAVTDTATVTLRKADLDRVMQEYPAIAVQFSKVLSQRLRDTSQANVRVSRALTTIALYSRALEPRVQTLLALNLAASLSKELFKRVILVDASGCEEELSLMLDIAFPEPHRAEFAGAHDVFDSPNLLACIRPHTTGIHVLSIGAGSQLKQRTFDRDITPILGILREHYEYILINCAPAMTRLIQTALEAADLLVYLTDSSDTAVRRCKKDGDLFLQGDSGQRGRGDQKEFLIGVVHDDERGHLPGRQLEELLAPHRFLTIHAPAAALAHFLRTASFWVYEHPETAMSLSVRHLARRIGRARVGLALGSGSARGFAHVGVLKVLEKHGIPIDMIAGTSMGAFVGGFYAAGITASQLEQLVLSYRDRRKVRRTIFDLTLPFYGLSTGAHLSQLMRAHLRDTTFDDLAIPFAAVATDINTGREVVLRHGLLWEALRASGSVPVMFEPYGLADRYLVDGSITNPLPTDILIEHDVDCILACTVNAVSTLAERPESDAPTYLGYKSASGAKKCGILSVLARSMGIMSATHTTNKARLADIDIRPNVAAIDWTDFHRGEELIRAGEEAAERAMPAILDLLRERRK